MHRLICSTILATLAMLLVALPAAAGMEWCARDPIVRLDGTTVQILVAVPRQYERQVTGPDDVEIATPKGTKREVLFVDAGFNGHGERVRFVDEGRADGRSLPVGIRVTVPLRRQAPVPVQLTIIVDDNEPIIIYGTSAGTTADLQIQRR